MDNNFKILKKKILLLGSKDKEFLKCESTLRKDFISINVKLINISQTIASYERNFCSLLFFKN